MLKRRKKIVIGELLKLDIGDAEFWTVIRFRETNGKKQSGVQIVSKKKLLYFVVRYYFNSCLKSLTSLTILILEVFIKYEK